MIKDWFSRVKLIGRRSHIWLADNFMDLLRIATAIMVLVLLIGGINEWNRVRDQAQSIQRVQMQQAQILQQLQKTQSDLEKNTAEQFAKENAYIHCLAVFFAQPDRTNKAIANLNNCEITTTGSTGSQVFEPTPAPASSGQTAGTSTPAKQPSVPAPAQKQCTVRILRICL